MKKILLGTVVTAVMATACNSVNTTDEKALTTDTFSTENAVPAEKATVSGYQVGDEATDFSLKNVDGNMVSLASLENAKGYIVIFTCNHCPYAKAYEQRIVALDKKYKPLGYPVVAVNPNDPALQPEDSYEKMQENAKAKGFTFPYLIDEHQSVYPQYGATKTPHVYLIQKEDGKNIVKYIGAIDDNYQEPEKVTRNYVAEAVDALIAQKPITETSTKAIGCSIKDKRTQKD